MKRTKLVQGVGNNSPRENLTKRYAGNRTCPTNMGLSWMPGMSEGHTVDMARTIVQINSLSAPGCCIARHVRCYFPLFLGQTNLKCPHQGFGDEEILGCLIEFPQYKEGKQFY